MCNPASGVFTKGHRAWWSKNSDDHEIIIREHGLYADGARGPNIVRFEITPPNGDITRPLNEWVYHIDESKGTILPEWYFRHDAEKSARAMLTEWAAQKIIRDRDGGELRDGEFYVINSRVEARENSSVTAWDHSSVTAWGNSRVTARGKSSVTAWGNSTLITYIKADLKSLLSSNAVIVDRSVSPPRCYVGVQK